MCERARHDRDHAGAIGDPVNARRVGGFFGVAALCVCLAGCAVADDQTQPIGRVGRYCATQERFGELDLLSDPDPEAVREDLRELLALTRRAARDAPREIRADAEAAVTAQVRFNGYYAANAWDPDVTNRDRDFIAFANSPELGALYVRLEAYQSRVCGSDRGSFDDQLA